MDIMDYLTSDQLHQSILCAVELIATKCIAVIVQPFASSLNGPQADFADNSHGTGRQSEETQQIRQMDPFLKGTKSGFLIGKGTEPDSLAVGKNDLKSEHHIGDPTVARHAVANTALINHGANHHRRAVGAKVRQHQTVLPQGVMNGIDARAALGG